MCLRVSNNDVCGQRGTYHTLYQHGDEFPDLLLTSDPQHQWLSGIKRCEDNSIIFNIDAHSDDQIVLSQILRDIHKDRINYLTSSQKGVSAYVAKSPQSSIHVHLLMCTTNIPEHLVDTSANKSIMTDAYTSTGRKIPSVLRPPNGIADVFNMNKPPYEDMYKSIKKEIDKLLSTNSDYDWQFEQLHRIVIRELKNTTEQHMNRMIGLCVLMRKRDNTYHRMAETLYNIIFRDVN